jgi:hypothetical protein
VRLSTDQNVFCQNAGKTTGYTGSQGGEKTPEPPEHNKVREASGVRSGKEAAGSPPKGEGTSDQSASGSSETGKSAAVDYDRLWRAVFEEGESLKGSFNLLRVGTILKKLDDNSFTVEASNEMTLYYVKENASDLETLIEKHTGKKLHMECCVAVADDRQEKEKTAEELADEIGNKFGIHIDVH